MKLNDFQKTTWEKFDVVGLCSFDLDVTMATNFGMPFFFIQETEYTIFEYTKIFSQ